MKYQVLLTAGAEADLEALYRHVRDFDSPGRAEALLVRVVAVAGSLTSDPARGGVPREFQALGVTGFRQVFFKPYRTIYRIETRRVLVYLVADGRRDLQALLAERLLRP